MKKSLFFISLALYFLSCAPKSEPVNGTSDLPAPEEFIVGGHLVTKKNEIALTTVSLLNVREGSLCTASILSEDIAITAAHCVDGVFSDMQLSFGPRSAGNETRPVEDIQVAPVWTLHQHDQTNNGDLALVKFSGGIPKSAAPATLMKSSHHLTDGEIVTLAGFGIKNGNGDGAGRLRSVDVKIAKANYSQTEVALDQTKRRGACHGDSGGPAFIQDNSGGLLLWGVTSRGINDPANQCAGLSVYTRILPYAKWINSVVHKWHM